MKGIILAGGQGTRLRPLTNIVSKQLLPVYDKPLIFYPLSTLMLANIRQVLIITNPSQIDKFQYLLGNGKGLGLELFYEVQPQPLGIAHSLVLGQDFLDGDKVALILGDNIFHGPGLGRRLENFKNVIGSQVFGYHVNNPTPYGIATVDEFNKVIELEEKPKFTESRIAIPGLYFLDETASRRSHSLEPSPRGELEIIDLLQTYLCDRLLQLEMLPRGTAWFDTGTFSDLLEASNYVKLMQERTGEQVGNPYEIFESRSNWK